MIIVGAGATAYSQWANPDRRPPLSNEDLLRMFNKPAYHIPAIDMDYSHFFTEAFKLYDYDIEALFTELYMLANYSQFSTKEKVLKLIEFSRGVVDIDKKKFSNMLTIFQGKLFMEMQLCIGTKGELPIPPPEMPICSWHRKIASQLNSGDVVTSFNYDLIMPYALLNERKLSAISFANPYIKEVDIPKKFLSSNPVTFITPHGSFAWQMREKLNYHDSDGVFHPSEQFFTTISSIRETHLAHASAAELADLNFKMDPPYIRVGLNNNPLPNYEQAKVILPLKKKKQILNAMPYFKEEYEMFLNKLKQADEVCLIGKNFLFSDQDIAEDINNTCLDSLRKHVVYINPDAVDKENLQWITHHNSILNAASYESYKDLFQYISTKGL